MISPYITARCVVFFGRRGAEWQLLREGPKDGPNNAVVFNNKYAWWSGRNSGDFDGGLAGEQYPDRPANAGEVALTLSYGHPTRLLSQTDATTTTLLEQEAE